MLKTLCAAVTLAAVATLTPAQADEVGYCQLSRTSPGTSTCIYIATTPIGRLYFYEGSSGVASASCTVGSASRSSTGQTDFIHGGQCTLRLTTYTSGYNYTSLTSVLL